MRLVIAFDTRFNFKSTDLVIGKTQPEMINKSQFFKVDNLQITDYVGELECFKEKAITKTQSKIIKGTIYSSVNNFNRNWIIPLLNWFDTIDFVLSKNIIDQIIIVGYTKNIDFIPYYEAEGEIGKQLFYKDYDVIPSLIYEYLKNKGLNKIEIKNIKSTINLKLRIFTRRYVLLFLKLILFYFKKLKCLNYKAEITNTKKIKFLLSTRSIAHSEYMYKFLKKYNDQAIIHTSDGLKAGNKNLDFIKRQNFKNVVSQESKISILEATTIFFIIVKALIILNKNQSLEIRGIKINMTSAIREMLISYFDALLYKKSIKNTVKQKEVKLVTGEMYTPFAYVISEIGKENSLTTYQLQTTAMIIRKEPNFVYCDYFLMNSKENAIAFKNIYPKTKNQIKFYGSLLFDEKILKTKTEEDKLKKVIFFTQPKVEEDIEISIIKQLIKLGKKFSFQTYIKIHPRDTKEKLNQIQDDIKFVKKNLIFNEYINDFDLAIIRNTSLGSSLIIEGIPTIVCLISENAKNSKMNYIDHNYYGTVFKIEDIEERLKNFNNLKKSFKEFRKDFITNNELTKGVDYFYNCFET